MACSKSPRKNASHVCCIYYECEVDNQIQWKCVDCELPTQDNYKETEIRYAKERKTAYSKEVDFHVEETDKNLDFTDIKCKQHTAQTYHVYCKTCDKLACCYCISKAHMEHDLVGINEGYDMKIERLKKLKRKLQKAKTGLTYPKDRFDQFISTEFSKYFRARQDLQAKKKALETAVQQNINKMEKELEEKWKICEQRIMREVSDQHTFAEQVNKKSEKIEELINTTDVTKFFKETEELEKPLNDIIPIANRNNRSIPKFVPEGITLAYIGVLRSDNVKRQNLRRFQLNVTKEHLSKFPIVTLLSACNDKTLWISSGSLNALQKVKLEENNLKIISNFDIQVFAMGITSDNDLLLVTEGSTLQQIDSRTGELTDTKYDIAPLDLTTVHVARDDKVMVGAKNRGHAFPATGRRVVIVMSKKGDHEIIFEHDRNTKTLFTYPRDITSTSNGNIFVVDLLSRDGEGRVLMLGQDGDVIGVYTGHSDVNTKDKPFRPKDIVSTPSNNIIVADFDTNTLHIMNCLGHPMTHFNTENIGILYPYSLGIITSRQLYIGCSTEEKRLNMAKIYSVNIFGL